ncbi:Hca operon transcriptional activator [Pigmentiphaga humi]|uniref:Hca operon transcriptional activator n=1 Tax=Pigmentiphaga humi TaxID=2478468 RepID=A0A3P4B7Q6_9BURK|nr:LysR substrate-binding domain-containing protein [Pigmentiphaga humi]VCU71718.1 Hca operon transcriptional activator [Pigmentiphaga humi]
MDLQQLESFVHVAELGSLTRAASVLGVSQPTLSRHIRLLEQDLHTHLLTRTGRGVEPTESGKCLLSYGLAILKLTRQARTDIQALRGQPTGRLTVGLPPRVAHVLTPELVKQFRRRYPQASISVSEGLSAALREDLILGKIEIALLFDPSPSPKLEYRSLYREDMVLCGRPTADFPLPAHLQARELERYPVLAPSIPNAIRAVIEANCRPHGIKLNVVAEVDAVHTLLKLAQSGQGYAIVPRSAAPASTTRAGKPFHVSAIGAPRILNDLVLATARDRPLSQLAQGTVALLAEQDIGRLLGTGAARNS